MTPANRLPRIVLLGTGGTIAATAHTTTQLTDYTVTEGVHSLLEAVPGLRKLAHIQSQQVFNIDSRAMSSAMLLKLAQHINEVLTRDDVDAVVITHGTDTLEETACFLHWTIKSSKPVILTAAMRPASAYSADGSMNLYHAMLTACHPQSVGQGVLVVLNDQIHSARFLTKQHTSRVDAFASPDAGPLGQIANGQLRFLVHSVLPHTTQSEFDVRLQHELPRVLILFDHPDACPEAMRNAAQNGVSGFIIAATGNGSITPGSQQGIEIVSRMGVRCVRASRIGVGSVSTSSHDEALGLIAAQWLPAIKARILLQLALTHTNEPQALRQIFNRY